MSESAKESGRYHGVAGDADDAGVLAEEVKGLHRLLGQADDPLRGNLNRPGFSGGCFV